MRSLGHVTITLVTATCLAWEGAAVVAYAQPPAAPTASAAAPASGAMDQLLAPIALYPDQLLAQMLLCAQSPEKVQEFSGWLIRNAELTGTTLQDAAKAAGFEPSFVVIALFPQVVNFMADNIAWTRELGAAFKTDQKGVFESIQRLRAASQKAGNLKTTPQQTVQTRTTKTGEQAIVIEPANPQVVYVPQYDPQVVYTQPASTTTTVIVKEDDDDEATAAVAGAVVGFAAGIAIGAAIDNNYYYGPYGWHGGGYMYNDAWDDFYDDREDAREDWYDNREDAREDFNENREDARENAGERRENASSQRTERRDGTGAAHRAAGTARRRGAGAAQERASTARHAESGAPRDECPVHRRHDGLSWHHLECSGPPATGAARSLMRSRATRAGGPSGPPRRAAAGAAPPAGPVVAAGVADPSPGRTT